MKRYFSIPLHALLGLIVFFIAANLARFIAYDAQNWYRGYYWKKAQAEYERPFREDKIGGQTPEQTWEMFIAALEAGDVEKASGYLHVEKRILAKEELEGIIKDMGDSAKYAEKLKVYKKEWKIDPTYYKDPLQWKKYDYQYYREKETVDNSLGVTVRFNPGTTTSSIIFFKNSNGVWKIYQRL